MIHCLNAAVMYYYTTDINLDIAQVNHTKRELHNVFIRKLYRWVPWHRNKKQLRASFALASFQARGNPLLNKIDAIKKISYFMGDSSDWDKFLLKDLEWYLNFFLTCDMLSVYCWKVQFRYVALTVLYANWMIFYGHLIVWVERTWLRRCCRSQKKWLSRGSKLEKHCEFCNRHSGWVPDMCSAWHRMITLFLFFFGLTLILQLQRTLTCILHGMIMLTMFYILYDISSFACPTCKWVPVYLLGTVDGMETVP